MSLYTWYCQGPLNPSNCATFKLNPHWGRAATGKKKSCIYAHGVASVVSNSLQPCGLWPARLLCQRGSPCKNTGVYWPMLVVIPFWSTIFPAALATNSPEYLVLPKRLQPKQLHHLHTCPHWGRPKSSRAAPAANPSGRPTRRGGNKTTIETQGQCCQGRRPKTFPPAIQAAD